MNSTGGHGTWGLMPRLPLSLRPLPKCHPWGLRLLGRSSPVAHSLNGTGAPKSAYPDCATTVTAILNPRQGSMICGLAGHSE